MKLRSDNIVDSFRDTLQENQPGLGDEVTLGKQSDAGKIANLTTRNKRVGKYTEK